MQEYTNYAYYANNWYGETVPEAAFPKWLSRATIQLNDITMHRIDDAALEEFGPQIQTATCALMDVLFLLDKAENNALSGATEANIRSVSAGGESISYGAASTSIVASLESPQLKAQLLYETVRPYLSGTGLLFQGV